MFTRRLTIVKEAAYVQEFGIRKVLFFRGNWKACKAVLGNYSYETESFIKMGILQEIIIFILKGKDSLPTDCLITLTRRGIN